MRCGLLSFVSIALAAMAGAAPIPPAAKQTPAEAELKRLEGRWKAESLSLDGMPLPISIEFEFKGNLLISRDDPTDKDVHYNRVVLDPSAKLRRLTATEIEPPVAGKEDKPKAGADVSYCVYMLDGDKLTLAACQGKDAKFPESLDGKNGPESILVVMKRVKK